jgi:hypothetical protein
MTRRMTRGIVITDDGVEVSTPYSAAWVQTIKTRIPSHQRYWDEEMKIWVFDYACIDLVRQITLAVWPGIPEIDIRTAVPERPRSQSYGGIDDVLAQLIRDVPNPALAKIYRIAIASVHPDAGGDHEKAVAINRAWDRIRVLRGIG